MAYTDIDFHLIGGVVISEAKSSRHLSIMEFDHGQVQHESLGRAMNPGAAGIISYARGNSNLPLFVVMYYFGLHRYKTTN